MKRLSVMAIAVLLFAHPVHAQPTRAAFFGVTVIDMSPGGDHGAEDRRASMIAERLAALLEESGRYAFVDVEPVRRETERYANLAHCNGCDAAFARRLGADVAITGEVQKTSELILHMTIYLRDAETGALIGGGSADMRGNTDESWRRGVDFIVKRRILAR
jgi:hypothetical protein